METPAVNTDLIVSETGLSVVAGTVFNADSWIILDDYVDYAIDIIANTF